MSKYQFNMQIISYQKIELYKNGIANGNKNLKCIIVFNHVKMYLKKVTNFVFCFGLVFVLPRLGIFKACLLHKGFKSSGG